MPVREEHLWPFPDLRLVCGDVELRYIDDSTALALARLGADGIHAPGELPMWPDWTDGDPTEVAQGTLRHLWRTRADRMRPEDWYIELAVVRDGTPLGIQSLFATSFPVTKSVETGSWLGLAHQGRGIGTLMRQMVLHLAFAGFGAHDAKTSALADNPRSIGVTTKLGYHENGSSLIDRDGQPVEHVHFRLPRDAWEASECPEVQMFGVDGVRRFLQIDVSS